MKRTLCFLNILCLCWAGLAGQTRLRTTIEIPDIPGFLTLKCDFHTHTVFSDGAVWPDIRSEESWREGLDAVAITDHIEYLPHKEDLPPNHNRSFQIAKELGDKLRIQVIPGSEITRDMPPGHLNAIFISDADALETEHWKDALLAARAQGAFVFWNHPGWSDQVSDGVVRWYPEHSQLVEAGVLHGIEVVNGRDYYPEAHRWCLEKNLTMLANSDIHNPLNLDYHVRDQDHRPVTLVFAKENSLSAIKEALFAQRTAVYSGDWLIGKRQFLEPIFEASVTLIDKRVTLVGKDRNYVQLRNASDVNYHLELTEPPSGIRVPDRITLKARRTALLEISNQLEDRTETRPYVLLYTAVNLKISPDRGLPTPLEIEVTFVPSNDN